MRPKSKKKNDENETHVLAFFSLQSTSLAHIAPAEGIETHHGEKTLEEKRQWQMQT